MADFPFVDFKGTAPFVEIEGGENAGEGVTGNDPVKGPSLAQLAGGENLVKIHFRQDGTPRQEPPDLSSIPGKVLPLGHSRAFRREYINKWGKEALGELDTSVTETTEDIAGGAGSTIGSFFSSFSGEAILPIVIVVGIVFWMFKK